MTAATVCLTGKVTRRLRNANVVATTAVHWYHYCNITRPVSGESAAAAGVCSTPHCSTHCSRAAPAAGLQICESVLRKIRTQLPGEENSAAAGRGFCSTAAVTAGHSWGSAAAGSWPRHCSQCCRLSTLLPAHCRWSGYAVFTLGFCTMNTFKRIGVERFSKN